MVGHIEPQDLRRADEQRHFHPRRFRGHSAVEQPAEQVAQRPEPAQHGHDQMAG
jgi:hypothetical protein